MVPDLSLNNIFLLYQPSLTPGGISQPIVGDYANTKPAMPRIASKFHSLLSVGNVEIQSECQSKPTYTCRTRNFTVTQKPNDGPPWPSM
jgi:hypothetical protein